MKLVLSQLREITSGAVHITQEADGFYFYRFTPEQQALCKQENSYYHFVSFASSGITLRFRTNSTVLGLTAEVSPAGPRTFFSFDLLVNGIQIGSMDNFSEVSLPQNYAAAELPLGIFSKTFSLGAGEKDVCLYLPHSMKTVLRELSLDDGAAVEPLKRSRRLLAYGDSITQGFDALHPAQKYTTRLAEHLNAEEHNRGLSGGCFFPELLEAEEPVDPDHITVAYGTNDWNLCTREKLVSRCAEFYDRLSAKYPLAKIWAISPVWRSDHREHREFGDFAQIEAEIANAVKGKKQVTFLSGFHLIPREESLFGDGRLHPNDAGFSHYFHGLLEEMIVQAKGGES